MTHSHVKPRPSDRGISWVEYLFVVLIAIVALGVLSSLGEETGGDLEVAAAAIDREGIDGGTGTETESRTEGGSESVVIAESLTAEVTGARFYESEKTGSEGPWAGTVEFVNATDHHQYLTLEITLTQVNGTTVTKNAEGFFVPAAGSTYYVHWDNFFKVDDSGNATGDSVDSIQVTVTEVETTDENGQPHIYSTTGPSVDVEAPPPG